MREQRVRFHDQGLEVQQPRTKNDLHPEVHVDGEPYMSDGRGGEVEGGRGQWRSS